MRDEEIINLIVNLFALHAPDSLDKRLVLERLSENLWVHTPGKCPKCGTLMVCPECDDIVVNTDVTLRIGSRVIYL